MTGGWLWEWAVPFANFSAHVESAGLESDRFMACIVQIWDDKYAQPLWHCRHRHDTRDDAYLCVTAELASALSELWGRGS